MEIYKLEEYEKRVTVLVGVGSQEEAGTQLRGGSSRSELPRVLNLGKEMDLFGAGAALH